MKMKEMMKEKIKEMFICKGAGNLGDATNEFTSRHDTMGKK